MHDRLSNLPHPLSSIAALAADRSGASAVILALALSGIVGTVGLGTEVAAWYATRWSMQGAADAASFTAATALAAGATTAQIQTEAKSVIASYNLAGGGGTVTVNNPPTSGNYTKSTTAVEVLITQQQVPMLSSMFVSMTPTITSRSVATGNNNGTGCVLALDRGDVIDVTDTGSTTVNLVNCALYVNSDDPSGALTMTGGAVINASAAYVVGGISTAGGAKLNTSKGTYTGVNPINDPYAGVAIPSYSGCDQTSYKINGGASATFSAGASPYVFCKGLSITGNSTVTLNPGVYVIDRGTFSIEGGSTLNAGGGVTLVLTSSTGSGYATASIKGGANVTLTAPTTGSTAGLAFYQDRSAPNTGSDDITGGSTQTITGAIYFPSQTVNFAGGGGTNGCMQLVSWKMKFTGSSTFNDKCSGDGTQNFGPVGIQIVE